MPDDALDTLAAFRRRMLAMPARLGELIRSARAEGYTWQSIAEALEMTVQGARKVAQQ